MLNLGQSVAFPVVLGTPAPTGGVVVTLISSDPSRVTIFPSSIFIGAGSTSPATQPQITAVNIGSATITASAPGYAPASATAAVSATLTFVPQSLTLTQGATQIVILSLSTAAPPGGFFAQLQSDNPAVAMVQGTLGYFPDGSSHEDNAVPITGLAPGTTVIHASALPFIPDTTITVTVVVPGTISLPTNVSLGVTQSIPFPVQLGTPAPPGGVSVTLLSSDQNTATVTPGIVFIAAGSSTPATQPQLNGTAVGQATISASAIGYAPASVNVSVIGVGPAGVTATGGTPQSGLINAQFGAPFSATVTDAKNNPLSGVTVTFRAPINGPSGFFAGGQGTATATTNANGVATSPVFIANGTQGSYTVSALVTGVGLPAVFLLTNTIPIVGPIILPANVVLAPNQSASFPVTLGLPAPSGGLTITLASSDPTKVSISPSSVFIAGGATAPAIQPVVAGINFGSTNISASATGVAGTTQLVQVNGTMSFTPSTLTVVGTSTQNLTLNLSAPAPAGLTINLASSNTGAASVPASVTFAAGAASATVPVTGVSVGATTITASSSAPANLPNTTANVTVKPTADIIVASGVVVGVGESTTLSVSLAQPAPTFLFVSLVSSDVSKVTVSLPNVVFLQGSTTPFAQPLVTGLGLGAATITASSFNLTGDSESVQVVARLGLGPNNATVLQGASQQLFLTLSSPLSTAQTVTLTSDNANVITVPPSVTIPANTTGVSFAATSVKPGATAIHATSSSPSITSATVNINVAAQTNITLPSSITVTRNGIAPFPVLLGSPAPAGGITVTLISSNSSLVTISPTSIFIAAGATASNTQPQVTGIDIGSATISASAPGYTPASQTVTVDATLTFSPQTLTLAAGSTQIVHLTLSTAAPPGGFFVTLTSDNPNVASVQSFLGYFPDGSAFEVNALAITAGSPGSTVIHVTVPPFVPVAGTSIQVTVVPAGP
jgi:hypothetical protein